MRVFAISDLHLDHKSNWEALQKLPAHADDWLILAGDICNESELLDQGLDRLTGLFRHLVWVPGNHELWITSTSGESSSVEKYQRLVEICRRHGVFTPEDDFPIVRDDEGQLHRIAPLHLLYDYSFRPAHIAEQDAVAWAREDGILCRDEQLIAPAPFASKAEWCRARVDYSLQRLQACDDGIPLILVNHFPLRQDLVRLRRIPRFSIWCGTRASEDWHRRFGAEVVVSGHLHLRATDYREGVRFEEVSLGYPRDWQREKNMDLYLREILPGPKEKHENAGPFWRRWR